MDTHAPGSEIIITVRTDETSSSVDYTVANTIRRDAAVLLGDMLGGRQAGVGLGNIRRRLELIYGNRAEFSVTNDGQRFITHMKISGLEKFH